MTVQTRNVYLTVHDAAGIPLENAKVKIRLVGVGNEQGGAVSPESRTAYTDEDGYVEFTLWENRQDYSDTHYELSSWHPTKRTAIHARVPFRVFDSDADIVDLISTYLAAVPVDATQALLDQVIAARAACEDSASIASDSLSTVQNIQQDLLEILSTITSGAQLQYYSGTPAINLDTFITPARFVINYSTAGIDGHPLAGRDSFYIDPNNHPTDPPFDGCEGIEIEVSVAATGLKWQRATITNAGTTLVRQWRTHFGSYGPWRAQSNSALFDGPERASISGSGGSGFSFGFLEFWTEGRELFCQGFFTVAAFSGSQAFTSLSGTFPSLERPVVFPLNSVNAVQTGEPRVLISSAGVVTVISSATTTPGDHYFQGRCLLPAVAS
jgi:hypothetical protein